MVGALLWLPVAAYAQTPREEVSAGLGPEDHASPEAQAAMKSLDDAETLFRENKLPRAAAAFDQLAARYATATDVDLQRICVLAMIGQGKVAQQSAKHEDALRLFDEVLGRVPALQTGDLELILGQAMMLRLGSLMELKRFALASEQSQTIVDLLGKNQDPMLRELAALAMSAQVAVLAMNGDTLAAEAKADALIAKFPAVSGQDLQERLQGAIFLIPAVLDEAGKYEQAATAYAHAAERAEKAGWSEGGEALARGLTARGRVLERLGRDDEAMAAYQAAINRFPTAKEPWIVGQMALCHNRRAGLFAKRGLSEDAIAELKGVLALGRSLDIATISEQPNFRPLFRNAAFILFLRSNGRR